MNKKILFTIIFTIILTSCGTPKKRIPTTISGVGSSFSLPLSSKLFRDYSIITKQKINYSDSSSYIGIDAIINGDVDFALSIAPMSDEQLAQSPNILHIPIAVGSINFAYHITNKGFSIYDDPVYLTPKIIRKIFLGTIVKWNDSKIVNINKKVAQNKTRIFPNLPIITVHRSNKSGDTYLLSQFLTKSDPYWAKNIGIQSKISWPIGLGQRTTLDIMRSIILTNGSFGYSAMIFGMQNNIPVVRVKNHAGIYVRGCNFRSQEAMKLAEVKADNRVDLTYPKTGTQGAVASGFIYLLVRQEQNYNNRPIEQAQATVNFINWLLSPMAQRELDPILFAPLTPKFRNAAKNTLNKITYDNILLLPNIIENKNN